MKILFVEDELKKNVTGVIELFEKYLGAELIKELESARDDDWASNEDIKKVVEKCGLIEVAYSFPQAVKAVKNHGSDYSLFVVDCNLSEQPYNKSELEESAPEFGDDQKQRYNQREGEYLLLLLSKEEKEIKEKFYFLSAYSPSNNVLGLIDNGTIARDNYVEKGCSEDKKRLIKKVINKNKNLEVRLENKEYLEILKKLPHEKANYLSLFTLTILDKDKNDGNSIKANLNNIRSIFEAVLKESALKLDTPSQFWDRENLITKSYYKQYLTGFQEVKGKSIRKYNFETSSVIFYSMDTLYCICSDYGSHDNPGYKPTANTVNALIFALKEIILWYGQITEKK